MARLIDADSLLVELDEWEKIEENSERALGVVDAKVIACQMPTVEAIPIDFIVEFKEDYCNAKSEKCDIGIANALVELMLCWEDEQEGLEWRNDHERIPSKQQSVEAIPIEYICPRIETLNKYISKWGGSFEHEEMVNAYIHEVSALVRLIEDWRKEE